jgi:hypothetical protein
MLDTDFNCIQFADHKSSFHPRVLFQEAGSIEATILPIVAPSSAAVDTRENHFHSKK